jgi:FtsH-binding integral membrane protein
MHGGMWVLFIAEFILVIWLTRSLQKISAQAATIGFLAYSVLNGMTISGIFLVYTAASISSTFFITAMTFAGVSVYGWVTKQDLTSVGSFCFMALIGVIVASIVNMFFHSPVFYWIVSYCGVAVFIGLTAYDTQRLKAIHQSVPNAPEQLAIVGALMLYLDFINMFLFLLQIFGRRR